MYAAGRHGVVRQPRVHAVRIDLHGGAGFDHFLDRLHAGPDAGKAAHGIGMDAEIENLLHAGREEHRHAAGLEDVVALVRGGGALGDVVIAGDGNHAAPGAGASHVGVLEHVHAAIDAGALAVPDAEYAIKALLLLRGKGQLLAAPDGGGGELLVDAGLEHDVVLLEAGLRLPEHLVIAAEWRAAIAADEAGGALAGGQVALLLQHGKPDQGLHAAHEGFALRQRVLVVQGGIGPCQAGDGKMGRCVHGCLACSVVRKGWFRTRGQACRCLWQRRR